MINIADLLPTTAAALVLPEKQPHKPKNRFPIEALPLEFRQLLTSVQKEMDLPLDYFGGAALSVMSYFVGNRFRLRVNPQYYVPACNFIALVGPSSDGKSPVLSFMLSPIWEQQRELRKDLEKQVVIFKNATVEAIPQILKDNPYGCLYAPDELSELLAGMNQYKGGKGNDDSFFLDVWNNAYINKQRVIGGSTFIERPFMNILGGLQYERLYAMSQGDKLRSGFFNRFLFCLSESDKMTRTQRTTIDSGYSEALKRIYDVLKDIPNPITRNGEEWSINNYTVDFNNASFDVFSRFEDSLKTEAEESGNALMREGVGKLTHYCLRIALCLHVAETMLYYSRNGGVQNWNLWQESQVSVETMQRAIETTRYFKRNFDTVADIVTGINQQQIINSLKEWQKVLFLNLPDDETIFRRSEAIEILNKINDKLKLSISERTLSRFLTDTRLFTTISSGKFRKK